MSADQPESRLFGRFSLRDAPGWLVSLGVHLAIMVVLLLVKFNTHINADSTFLNAIEDVTTETAFDPTDTDQVGIGTEVTSLSATSGDSRGTAGAEAGPSAAQTTSDRVNTSFTANDSPKVNIKIGGDELAMPRDDILTASIGPGVGSGGGTENVAGEGGGGVESAIDRL